MLSAITLQISIGGGNAIRTSFLQYTYVLVDP
jgi:hypothetical protein